MNKFIFWVFVLVFTIPFGKTLQAASTKTHNILVISVDTAKGSLSRKSPIVRSAVRLVEGQLASEGLAVYQKTVLGFGVKFREISQLKHGEIIGALRELNRPPIDLLITIAVFPSYKKIADAQQIRVRITGKITNVHTGQLLSSLIRKSPFPVDLPLNCNRQCLVKNFSKITNELAQELGGRLKQSIVPLEDLRKNYSITFKGFRKEDLNEFESFLRAFSGYAGHHTLKSTPDSSEFWYETTSGMARLHRNLGKTLEHLGLKGRVEMSGHNIEITNIAP